MTLLDLEQNVFRRTDKNVLSPDTVTKARIDTFLNDRYRELCRITGILDLRDESFSFTTESGRARYALPLSATAITSVVDTQHRLTLQSRTLAWIRERDPSVPAQVTGTPFIYAVLNNAGVAQQPTITTANALEVVSTSAADDGTLEIEYQDAAGGFNVVALGLAGVTPSPLPASAQVSRVFRMVLRGDGVSPTPSGTITLRQIADGRVIVIIPRNQTTTFGSGHMNASAQWVLHLWPTPSGAIPYVVDGTRPRAELVQPDDMPIIPEDFHTLLVWGACEDELLKMDDTRRQDYARRWDDDVKRLRFYLQQARGERLIPGMRGRVGWTPLGSQFPPWQ